MKFVKNYDNQMINTIYKPPLEDKSGLCLVCYLRVNDSKFIMNVGDCRAIMVNPAEGSLLQITTDHRLDSKKEAERVINNGGQIYRNASENISISGLLKYRTPSTVETKKSPLRMFPGNLSISRALGNGFVKRGYKDILICDPDVYDIQNEHGFIIMASDGVFDCISNNTIYQKITYCLSKPHRSHADCVSFILKELFTLLIDLSCEDNISMMIIYDRDLNFVGYSSYK